MKPLFSKPLSSYTLIILLLVGGTGIIHGLLTENYIFLIALQCIEFIILILVMSHVYHHYIHPIQKSVHTVDELVKGNYRARVHHPAQGSITDLGNKINMLARSLSEFSIQEEVKAKQLLTVINNIDSGLALIDEKGYIHLVNRKFTQLFGDTMNDYVGYLYYEVMETSAIHETVQRIFLYEKNMKDHFTLQTAGDQRHFEIVGAPVFNEKNILKGAVLVFYDITEYKRLELMRKDFVANVSHELKTPVTSIMGFAETLLEDDTDEETKRRFLEIIYTESKHLRVLIDDLLTLSKLEHADYHLNVEQLKLSELLDSIVPVIQHLADHKQINFICEVEENISWYTDREKMKQVLKNLLVNAISYTPEKGTVRLRVFSNQEHISFEVKDTGIGIAEEDLPRIFERFYRVDKARSRNTGGTGLGLAIVKHIVEVHGGNIRVESDVDEGTSFHVMLPKHPNRK